MAGAKDRSGGPRANAGGARAGAGRPKKDSAAVKQTLENQPHGGALKRRKSVPVPAEDCDMLQLLQDIALGKIEASTGQIRAAIAAVQYTHTKKGDGGKKEDAADKAKKAGSGRFGLRVVQ